MGIKGMSNAVKEELREKAFFVSGKGAWFRANADARANSAIHDAEKFLNSIRFEIPEPHISAGTTADPDNILVLSWLIGGYRSTRAASLSCKGYGKFDVSWEDPLGHFHELNDIQFPRLRSINLPKKVLTLQKMSSAWETNNFDTPSL